MASMPFKAVSTPNVVRSSAGTAVSYSLSAAGKESLSVQKSSKVPEKQPPQK
jgi:hypothetical protein